MAKKLSIKQRNERKLEEKTQLREILYLMIFNQPFPG
jgi:hypothetical protein